MMQTKTIAMILLLVIATKIILQQAHAVIQEPRQACAVAPAGLRMKTN
jgi:hypothetical protein